MKCQSDGCRQIAEFYSADDDYRALCSDCIQEEVETGEYEWDDCDVIEEEE